MFRSTTSSILIAIVIVALQSINTTAASSNPESEEFLKRNAKKPGVNVLPSGLQYKIIRTGLGNHHPDYGAPAACHYKGTLIDGVTEFDSSYKRGTPSVFQPRQVIKGWTEAMQLMVEGDKWELYIPGDLAYGERGSPPHIKPGDALIFTMEIVELKGTKVDDNFKVRCKVESGNDCTEKETGYIEKMKKKFMIESGGINDEIVSSMDAEIDRIKRISEKGSDANVDWANRRIRILNQMKDGKETATEAASEEL